MNKIHSNLTLKNVLQAEISSLFIELVSEKSRICDQASVKASHDNRNGYKNEE
jgi:hypothetical protein